ncbi:MAG: hypothetical protein Q8908_03195 [Bacteroidota bacterium]|nr:hypothetical protein [Bacteroidota bacterium]
MIGITLAAHAGILRMLGVFVISGLKFIVAPFMSIKFGFTYSQTLVYTAVGGIAGVWFFYHLSHIILAVYHQYYTQRVYPYLVKKSIFHNHPITYKKKKIFSRKSRFLGTVRSRFGLPGIVILTPVLLSIPVGTFLAITYYSHHRHVLAYLAASVVCWTVILTPIGHLLHA